MLTSNTYLSFGHARTTPQVNRSRHIHLNKNPHSQHSIATPNHRHIIVQWNSPFSVMCHRCSTPTCNLIPSGICYNSIDSHPECSHNPLIQRQCITPPKNRDHFCHSHRGGQSEHVIERTLRSSTEDGTLYRTSRPPPPILPPG